MIKPLGVLIIRVFCLTNYCFLTVLLNSTGILVIAIPSK